MRKLKTSAVLAAALLGMFVGSARAEETVVAKVPFPFVLRGQEFRAGRYSISTEQGMLMIRGIDNTGGAFALTVSAAGYDPIGDQPALVFVRYENGYRLSQVWPSSTEGLTVQDPSVVEHHASAASAASIVAIAASYK
jgi:hypothetical protein